MYYLRNPIDNKIKNNKSGFTIVELLIVIVIIGILAAIVITAFNGVQQKARNISRVESVEAILKSMQLYQAINGKNSLYAMLPATGSGDGWCIGTDYEDVDPGPSFSCRYEVPNVGYPSSSPVIQPLYDAIHGVSQFSMKYSPVTQVNFGGYATITSSSPFITRNQFSDTGLRYTLDGGALVDYYALLSYRLEGVDQNCQIPVVRISSQTATQRNYISNQPFSITNGGATECWVWLDW